jgi:hypothetical protein
VAHQFTYVVWCSVQVNMWHISLHMWCGAVYRLICGTPSYICGVVYRLICGTPAYVCGVVYIHHTLAVFTPLCKAVNILS